MEQYITIGKITSTHGCRGEFKIYPLTDFPERFFEQPQVLLWKNNQQKKLELSKARWHKNQIIAASPQITDLDRAALLKGSLIQIPREEVKKLPRDHFYLFEIVGLEVYDLEKGFLGTITEVIQTAANDVYVIQPPEGKPILIPALKKVVRKVDLEEGKMEIILPEEENAD